MANDSQESVSKRINTWVQTIGIIVAAAWGIYTFVYKEVFIPKSAPINITLDLELREIQAKRVPRAHPPSLVPVEMTVSARNPSPREIRLLPSAWVAYGDKVVPRDDKRKIPDVIVSSTSGMVYLDVHAMSSLRSLVAFGRLFSDVSLMPNEVLKRKLIFYVPPNHYDFVSVNIAVPSVTKAGSVDLEWKLSQENPEPVPVLYRIDGAGKREVVNSDQERKHVASETELQVSGSMSQVALTQ
jgi:hypothetical protein